MPLITEEQARARYLKEKNKLAASTKVSPHTKARIGRRPIRVHTLLKKEEPKPEPKTASQSGADLRVPLMGGTKFPTNDSLAGAKKTLKEHQDNARMGGPTQSIKSTVPSARVFDVMPKVGAAMKQDPLIQYLKKQSADERTAGKDWPEGDRKIEKGELIDSSSMAAPTGDSEKALTDEDPTPMNPSFPGPEAVSDWKNYMANTFDNKVTKEKCKNKDYPATPGEVDKVIARG